MELLRSRILTFLIHQIAQTDERSCVKVELEHRPGGDFRERVVREWVRAQEPTLFEVPRLHEFVSQIIDAAIECADDFDAQHGVVPRRFIVRSFQFMGGRHLFSFTLEET